MRKWMSDRLKRRKKAGDDDAEQGSKKPEPLQPRFYDDEPKATAAPPVVEKPVASPPEAPPVSALAATDESSEANSDATSDTSSDTRKSAASPGESRPKIARRRRGRGGRGGSRTRKPGGAAATAGGAADGSEVASNAAGIDDSLPEGSESTKSLSDQPSSAPSTTAQSKADNRRSAAAPPPTQASTSTRPSKGTVVLAIGLPGSGKSSWFKRHNIHPLSSDLLRELLFDDAQEQRFQDLIFSNLRSMLKARLIARRPLNYVDATNLTPHDRQSWIKLAKDYGYDVQGVFFDVPLDVCMERHQRRGRAVPEDVMRKMAGKLKPPTFEEGFSKITVVRVKQKEKE